MRNCLLPASGFRVNVDNRYPVEEEGRVSPHEEQGQLLEEVANCLVLILARLSHSASEQAHFRHFQSVSETVFFVFSVNLIHILILFCPLWFRTRKYGRFMALFIFQ